MIYRMLVLLSALLVFAGCDSAVQIARVTPLPTPPETAPMPEVNAAPTEEPFYAWDFTLTSLEGETYTLSEMHGQWVLINFWATTCGPCVDEMPALQALADQYADEMTILAINQRESPEAVTQFKEALNLRFPLLLNPDDATLINYQVIGLPQTLVVDPQGEIVWRQFGPIDLEGFGAQLAGFMAGT